MARWFSLFLILILSASTAQGVSDPRPDVLGAYFDETGDRICMDAAPSGIPLSVWLIYTNPTPATILGFEAGYYFSGGSNVFALGAQWPCGIVWLVEPERDNLYVTCAEPFPTAEVTPLVRFDYLFLGSYQEATFHVEKASGSVQPGNGPHIILADGSLMEVLPGSPAFISYTCTVPATRREWGTIKSLFR